MTTITMMTSSCMQQINRRVLGEDGKGVGEALNETDHVIGRHLLILETPSKSSSIHRLMAQQFFLSPVVMFSRADDVIKRPRLVTSSLPDNVHLTSLWRRRDGTRLVRLEHQFARDEDSKLSRDVIIDLNVSKQ